MRNPPSDYGPSLETCPRRAFPRFKRPTYYRLSVITVPCLIHLLDFRVKYESEIYVESFIRIKYQWKSSRKGGILTPIDRDLSVGQRNQKFTLLDIDMLSVLKLIPTPSSGDNK